MKRIKKTDEGLVVEIYCKCGNVHSELFTDDASALSFLAMHRGRSTAAKCRECWEESLK